MSKAGKRILKSAREAHAFARGEPVGDVRVHVSRAVDVRAIRKRAGLSQEHFAMRIGVALGTLRNWEQGRREPEGPARVLLALIDKEPTIVEKTLGVETLGTAA